MSGRRSGKSPLFGHILAGGCFIGLGAYLASETAFTISIVSVTFMALVALFWEA